MYEAQFGLRERPFAESVDPSGWIALASHAAALRRVQYAFERVSGAALIHGPCGAGKSALARRCAAERSGPVIELGFPALEAEQLLSHIGRGLGCTAEGGAAQVLRSVGDQLARDAERGSRALLWIDDAHCLRAEQFELLRLLLNFRSAGPPDLDLLLCGSSGVVLSLPHGLADRIGARVLLGALDEEQASAYLAARLERAGGTERLFSTDAVSAMVRYSEGLPRRLNRLADLALLLAASGGRRRVDADLVEITARDLVWPEV